VKALVTGGSGFLGRRLIRKLIDRNMSARCLVREKDCLDQERAAASERGIELEVREGGLDKIGPDSEIAEGCDVVYHLAAELRGGTAGMFLTNVVATRALLSAAGRARVGRFVLVSSLGVYGTGHLRAGDALDESCPLDGEPHRRDPYSFSKIAQERAAWEAHERGEVPLVAVRPSVIYGPGREAITARVGLRLGGIVMVMGGRHPLPYTFVDNCASGIALAGVTPGIEGESFNLVDDELPTGRQIVRLHRRSVGHVRTLTVPRPAIRPLSRLCEWYHEASRGQLPAVLTPYKSDAQWKPLRYTNAKAKRLLGWSPEIGLDEGLKRTFSWLGRGDVSAPIPAHAKAK
jgi:nucleoside-diphosphate-sugar epimerase